MNFSGEKSAGDTLAGILVEAADRTKQSFQQPWIPPSATPRRFWVWAVLLAASWHALWWVWLSPRWCAARPHGLPAVRMTYLAERGELAEDGQEQRNSRRLWSPVLFALPTPVGFSQAVLEKDFALRPPLEAPGGSAMYLEYTPAPSAPLEGLVPGLPDLVQKTLQTYPGQSPARSVFTRDRQSRSTAPLTVEFGAGLADVEPLEFATPKWGRLPGGKAWEATAVLMVDKYGMVQHTLLESSSTSDRLDRDLVRFLKKLRFGPMKEDRAGHVTIRYAGPREAGVEETAGGVP